MPKPRVPYATALARLLFAKDVEHLSAVERAQLDVLRALDGDTSDEATYEALARDFPEEAGDVTVH
jgi:hypothetical protein